jgi:uncharacterized protein DUF3467
MTQSKGCAKGDRASTNADQLSPALYVNYFEVGHNPFEFLLDLGQYHPGSTESDGRIAIHTRVALAPPYAKMLSELLARAIKEHESQHGEITLIGPQVNPFDIVLSSLGDFEDRARALRSRDGGAASSADGKPPNGDGPSKPFRTRRGR